MTRGELKKKVNNLSCHLTYPILDDLHDIDDHDAEQRQVIEQLRKELDLLKADDAEGCELIRDMEDEERRKDAEIEQLKLELNDTWVDDHGTTWSRPTAWAYAQVCKARDTWQRQAEQQAQEIARLENGLGCSRSHPHEDMNQICELRTEVARLKNELSHWTWVRFKQLEEEDAALREALKTWQSLFRQAVNVAGSLTNYVEDRPELHHAERRLELLEQQAQQVLKEVKL